MGPGGVWKVGRVGAEVAQQPPTGDCDESQQSEKQCGLGGLVVAHDLYDEDEPAQDDHQQRDAAMEAPRLRVGPGIQRAYDLPPVVRVSTGRLARAPVADVGLRSVAHQAPLVVELVRPQVLTLGALPVVVRLVVGEACGAVAQRTLVRVR